MIDITLPLTDIHRHLDGNIRAQTILDLSRQFNIALPAQTLETLIPHVQVTSTEPDLVSFLTKLDWGVKVLASLDACRRVAFENIEDAARNGLHYVELRFSPGYMAMAHQLPIAGVVEAVIDGVRDGCNTFGVEARLIGIMSRTFGEAACLQELDALLAHREKITALDLAGVYTGCAIGISLAPRHGQDSESLIRTADTAMYNAKEGGRGQFCVFSPEMNQRVFDYHWLDTNLRKALENDQLLIHYQPKITWRGEVRSLEALVRWQSPERGLIPPLEFISYAEESGLIVPLGRWVILDVVRQIAKWRDKGINLRVAVNFSARQLADQTLFTALKQALYDLNFEYCPIDVELTESCLIENDTLALSVIQQFSQLGAQIHLDDFGTGYSSLSQLARFPIDAVKLDQAFVRDIHKQPLSQSLVRAIVAVAQALNLQVIAEGVENAKEDAFLTKNGVNERQGFLFAKPMPAVSFERWYKRYQTKKMR
ncbi:EAL domain-containing protein [Salmonella enterica]